MKAKLLLSLFIASLGLGSTASGEQSAYQQKDIVEIAVSTKGFETLVAAAQAAGLVSTLKSDGPLTVLAPTDKAFAKLGQNKIESLLRPENKDQLKAILTYHVVQGEANARAVLKADEIKTVNGETIQVDFRDGFLFLNDAKVQTADINASNGIIHVVDSVLIPRELSATEDSAGSSLSTRVIRKAIEKGVAHYNHGNARACADIYETAAYGLVASGSSGVSEKEKMILNRAMKMASRQNADDRAWTYRNAFDRILSQAMASR